MQVVGPDAKKGKVKEAVLRYVADRDGLIDIAACAEELGLKQEQVKRALVSLKRKGKVEF